MIFTDYADIREMHAKWLKEVELRTNILMRVVEMHGITMLADKANDLATANANVYVLFRLVERATKAENDGVSFPDFLNSEIERLSRVIVSNRVHNPSDKFISEVNTELYKGIYESLIELDALV